MTLDLAMVSYHDNKRKNRSSRLDQNWKLFCIRVQHQESENTTHTNKNSILWNSKAFFLHRNVKKQAVWTNFVQPLENSQSFMMTKWMLNEKTVILKIIRKFWVIPDPPLTPAWQWFVLKQWQPTFPAPSLKSKGKVICKLLCTSVLATFCSV